MSNRVALVFCVHHKPWLMMSTLITALAQDFQDADFHFIYNVGDGCTTGPVNAQLAPFDERVRDVCRLNRVRVFEVEYQNDDALDSGAWYKFIRDGRWKPYDWVLFAGEGTLFAHPGAVSAMIALAARRGNAVIASGHEKRRLPKSLFLDYMERHDRRSEADRLHDRMIARAFEIFCRDACFRRLFEQWGSDFPVQTEHHVPPAGPPSPLVGRLRAGWVRRFGPPSGGGWLQQLPWSAEYAAARLRLMLHASAGRNGDVGFHRVDGPEWFGCATNHLMSRAFLERLSAKLDEFRMWEVLELPFAGTALEVIWGFLPIWLGFEKWFTDGLHRVRKDFVTYRREDYPPEMATYINRYYRGQLAVGWSGDYVTVKGMARGLRRLRDELPPVYFSPAAARA